MHSLLKYSHADLTIYKGVRRSQVTHDMHEDAPLAALRSRWRTPFECKYDTAWESCMDHVAARLGSTTFPPRLSDSKWYARSPLSQYSITMHTTSCCPSWLKKTSTYLRPHYMSDHNK